MRFGALRAVNHVDEEQMNLHLASLEDLQAQAMNDLQVMAQSGVEPDARLREQLNNFSAEIVRLQAAIQTTDDNVDAIAAWHGSAATLEQELTAFIGQTSAARLAVTEGIQLKGLYWGVGAAVAVTILGVIVWRGRRKRRKD